MNETQVKLFILLGFSYHPHVKLVLFAILFAVYLVSLTANSLFILVTLTDSRLHSPMYFFLCNLSFLDLLISSVSGPTIMYGLLVQQIAVNFSQCMAQMYIHLSVGQTECFLLAAMAWDRYVAICNPLNYQQIMNNRVCINLAIAALMCGFIFALPSVVTLPIVNFCGHNRIDHTICEVEAVSHITCTNNQYSLLSTLIVSLFTLVGPVCMILFTYCRIISAILKMRAAEGRHRTFATCGSHLIVVVLFYGTAMVVYLGHESSASAKKNKSMSLFYVLVVPALNPLIYTLRNNEVKEALKKYYSRNKLCRT